MSASWGTGDSRGDGKGSGSIFPTTITDRDPRLLCSGGFPWFVVWLILGWSFLQSQEPHPSQSLLSSAAPLSDASSMRIDHPCRTGVRPVLLLPHPRDRHRHPGVPDSRHAPGRILAVCHAQPERLFFEWLAIRPS